MASLLKPQMQCHSNLQFLDSRPRACSHRSLFVRRTPTRPRARGQEPHFTQRLVRSIRCGSRVRQRTLRNLGRHVALPRGDWPALCARVERILVPQRSLELGACSPAVEDEAQRSAAQLVQAGVSPVDPSAALPRVDVDSLELVRPRSVGVEHVALWAMRQLRPPSLLEQLGLSGAQRAAVLGSLVGRMAAPASERAAWHWLRQRSALGELLGCDCETMGRNALQRASDRLLRHRDTIETRLLQRAADLFDLQPTVTLHDRTSTCFEGAADRLAAGPCRGPGRAPEAAVVLDRGLATEGNGRRASLRVRAAGQERRSGQVGARLERLRGAGRGPVAQGGRVEKVWRASEAGPAIVRRPARRDRRAGQRQGPQRDGGGLEAAAAGGQRGDPSRGPRPAHQQRRLGRRAAVAHLRDADRPGGRPPLPQERTGTAPIHHRRPACSAGRLCLSVLACQLVQVVRQRLRAGRRPAGRRCAIAWRASGG